EVALSREPSNPLFEGKLGLAFVRANDPEGGLQRLQHAIESRSSAPELHDRLILALVSLERIAEAAQAAEAKLGAVSSPAASDFLRAASLWSRAADHPRAAAMLQVGLQLHPESENLQRAWTELAEAAGIAKFASSLESTP